jgi:glutamate/tyrosine decarboxylase-like PLP-dependent enzyme
MMTLGEEGYNKHTKDILAVTQTILKGVQGMHGLRVMGVPEAMIVCFEGTQLQCYSAI